MGSMNDMAMLRQLRVRPSPIYRRFARTRAAVTFEVRVHPMLIR
jgi:hypothetical protein